jgi:cytochrome P450
LPNLSLDHHLGLQIGHSLFDDVVFVLGHRLTYLRHAQLVFSMYPQPALPYAVGAGICYLIYTLIWELFFSPTRSIAGPREARWTRLWYYRHVRSGQFHHVNIALHRKYGPVVRVAPGYFSISTPDKTVYGIGSKFSKGDWYQAWKHPSPDRWTLFPDQDIKRHAETRKRFQSLYSMSSLLSYEPYVDECVELFVDKLSQFAREGTRIDLAHWFQCYAFDVIGSITYSERFGFLDTGEDVAGTMAALDKSMAYSTLVGIFPKLHPYLYAVLEKIPGSGAAGRTYLMNFVTRKICERSSGKDGLRADIAAPQDFLEKLTRAHHQDPAKTTQYHIFMMALSNIIAGADTTAISLSSTLYHLITSPHALSNLRHELDLAAHTPSFKDTQALPYLQAVIKESLRLHPATGLPLWRVVPPGGVNIGAYHLPPGSNVGVNSWVAHYDEDVFGKDAHVFRPERWMQSDTGSSSKAMEAAYMPVRAIPPLLL